MNRPFKSIDEILTDIENPQVGTPEYCLAILINMRNAWLSNSVRTSERTLDIARINVVILNLELMIDK